MNDDTPWERFLRDCFDRPVRERSQSEYALAGPSRG